jgi:hypothetical protein
MGGVVDINIVSRALNLALQIAAFASIQSLGSSPAAQSQTYTAKLLAHFFRSAMRLLNATTLRFEDFDGDDIPRYVILSHRWEQDEISYREMSKATKGGEIPSYHPIRSKQGFQKVYNFSRQALREGFEYIWIDTCCINKDSSAELQEAINSMFQWYQHAGACFAYLSDVCVTRHGGSSPNSRGEPEWIRSFKESLWFTRGWTLQELLAPRELSFFDQNWTRCGSAGELHQEIYEITGIDINEIITHSMEGERPWKLRVGRRMSWAAHRKTTRIEDRAYSLLGLFEINMPLLYGEGKRAFQRLQEEIMQVDEDVSILAWSCTSADTDFAPNGLAKWPTHFHNYSALVEGKNPRFAGNTLTMSQRGLQATLKIQRDVNEKMLAYVILADGTYTHKGYMETLVLPIMFLELTFSRSHVQNECVRFSDPLWVASTFIQGAKPEPLCFVRHLQAAESNRNGLGLSLSLTAWKDYIPTLTYPVQAQPGSRHFPAVLGGFMHTSDSKRKTFTLIIELSSRTEPPQKYVVVAEGPLNVSKVSGSMTVMVAQTTRAVDLNYASNLVRHRSTRRKLVPCNLYDQNGAVIPKTEIFQPQYFSSYWINSQENDPTEASQSRVLRGVLRTKTISAPSVDTVPRRT